VAPLLLLALGIALLVAAWLSLRSLGPRFRIGRLLASTPRVTVAEALALADNGTQRYVRVDGRIDSDAEFEDPDHRPLVLRRTRIQERMTSGWRTLEDDRQQVPFEIREGLDGIGVDGAQLDQGLVVVPRESAGTAAELGERVAELAATTPVRIRIEQVSTVEHATVLGVPVRKNGVVTLTAGLGRPLVLTTLEEREAMRLLAEARPTAPRIAAVLFAGGFAATAAGIAWLVVDTVT
jgi:hypothetical protein